MATSSTILILSLALILSILTTTKANDPDILTDFITPNSTSVIDANFFTYNGLRAFYTPNPKNFTVLKATMTEFPALNGQSVSYAVLQFPAGGVNPPHTHPRAAELLIVMMGTLEVGFIDTKNVLFNQTLQEGDMFVFPKGLVHFQYNRNHNQSAIAISAFGSANGGLVSVPKAVFTSGIDDNVVAMSFKTDVATVQKIELGLKKLPGFIGCSLTSDYEQKLIYADPRSRLETVKDAFDLSVQAGINKVTKLRRDLISGRKIDDFIEELTWKYSLLDEGETVGVHEWDPFFSKPKSNNGNSDSAREHTSISNSGRGASLLTWNQLRRMAQAAAIHSTRERIDNYISCNVVDVFTGGGDDDDEV
ncbi:hypothetical protein LXL04_026904 [Taraxacum kok-saghyz]